MINLFTTFSHPPTASDHITSAITTYCRFFAHYKHLYSTPCLLTSNSYSHDYPQYTSCRCRSYHWGESRNLTHLPPNQPTNTIKCNNIGAEAGFHIADAGAKAVVFADPDAKRASECSTYLNSVMKGKHKRRDYKTTHFAFKNLEKVTVRAIVNDVIAAYGQIDYVVNTIGVCLY